MFAKNFKFYDEDYQWQYMTSYVGLWSDIDVLRTSDFDVLRISDSDVLRTSDSHVALFF